MKKTTYLLMMALAMVFCFTGCDKDDDDSLNLVGTNWRASVSTDEMTIWSTVYFKSSSSLTFAMGIDGESMSETFPYTVSGNTVKFELYEGFVISLEKTGEHLYWDFPNEYGAPSGMVLKYIKQ